VGDFIEASVAKGMVEHIFLRSPGLCSHRSPVHTIPFGDKNEDDDQYEHD
jgi:small-conductance mechanosensitive channel